jgi:Protein of unknown function (DUF3093)
MRSYREQLYVPVLWWVLAAINVLILGSEVWAGLGGIIPGLVYALLTAICVAFLLKWNSASIEVTGSTFRAGHDTLRLDQIGEVVALDEEESRVLRGPRADPAAHLLLRPYVKQVVYIAVDDPFSAAPYWLIATRRPAEVAAAIQRSRETVG